MSLLPKRRGRTPEAPAPVVVRERRPITPRVPVLLDVAAAWTWRVLILLAGIYVLAIVVARLQIVFLPVAAALLITALVRPLVTSLQRIGLGRLAATWIVILLLFTGIGGFLTLTGTQLAGEFDELGTQVEAGIGEVTRYLAEGPLQLDQAQIDEAYQKLRERLSENQGALVSGAVAGATVAVEVLAGLILALFTAFFLLYDGERIWDWIASRFPREQRNRVDSTGAAAWSTLTGYIRGTSLVAFVDALGVGLALALTGVPLVIPLALLTFFGGFIPLVGATLAGAAAVLVALVSQGPIAALIVLGAVIAVQQLEGHVLSPLVLGRAVQLHPLVIALSLAAGAVVAGIPGAIVAVPLVAVANRAAAHLAELEEETHPQVETAALADTPEPEKYRGARDLPRGEGGRAESSAEEGPTGEGPPSGDPGDGGR